MFENFIYSTMSSAINKSLVGLFCFLVGLALAAWLWHRFRDQLYQAQNERARLENEIRNIKLENRQYETLIAERAQASASQKSEKEPREQTATVNKDTEWKEYPDMDSKLVPELNNFGVGSSDDWLALSPLNQQRLDDQFTRKGLSKSWHDFKDKHLEILKPSSTSKSPQEIADKTGAMAAASAIGLSPEKRKSVRPAAWEVSSKKLKPRFSAEESEQQKTKHGSEPVEKKSEVNTTVDETKSWEIDTKRKTMERFSAEEDNPVSPFKVATKNPAIATGAKFPSQHPPQLEFPRVHNDERIDWSQFKDIDPKFGAEFESMGIHNLDQLESLSLDDRRKVERHFSARGINWDWSRIAKWKEASEPVRFQIPEVSGEKVDWVAAAGIDNRYANEFQKLGVNSFEQLEAMGVEDRREFEIHMKHQGLNWNWAWLNGWKHSVNRKNAALQMAKPADFETAAPPTISTLVPAFRDDLTLLVGVEGPQARELQKMGIYNFRQLHSMHHVDRTRLLNWFRKRGWTLDMNQWRIASDGNTRNPTLEEIHQRANEIKQHRIACGLDGGDRVDWEQAEWELRGNPIFGYGIPEEIDDFAFTQSGIGPEARDELYRMGLYNLEQINSLNSECRMSLAKWFNGPRFGIDLAATFGWLSSNLATIPNETDFGNIYTRRPNRIDKLSDINGIGPATERDLNRIGIYQFVQIAGWTRQQAESVAKVLNLENRIRTDMWIVQAQTLSRRSQV